MKLANIPIEELNDDKHLKEMAEFIAGYINHAKELFFKGPIVDLESGGSLGNPIKKDKFEKDLYSWLDNNSIDRSELVKELVVELKKNSADKMHESFITLLPVESKEVGYASFKKPSPDHSKKLKAAIAENKYVKQSETLKEASKDSKVILVCEVLAKVCESFTMGKANNFFRRAANSLRARLESHRLGKALSQLTPEALQSVMSIRKGSSSGLISSNESKAIEMLPISKTKIPLTSQKDR